MKCSTTEIAAKGAFHSQASQFLWICLLIVTETDLKNLEILWKILTWAI